MARAGFGGGGDYSNLFGSLYSNNKAENRARQDASDSDAQDKWEHGLLTDDEWMAYIAGRIIAETDPKRKERWITAQREYVPLIADKQAEFAYENGGSINQLIAHYQTRLAGLVPNSNEYREVALKVNDLQDNRSAERLQEQADAMIEQINKGTATYKDLQKLLTTARDAATPNSDYRKSVDKQISQVREQIRVNKLEGSFEKLQYEYDAGKLSGGAYASRLRKMAQQFKVNDPKRYYQILEAATALSKAGGSGGGGGGGGSSATSARKAAAKSIDSLQGKRNRLLAISQAYEAGATSYVNSDGVKVALTPAYIASVDQRVVETLDQLATAYSLKGDKSAAGNQKKAKANYVSKSVVKHNTMSADESSRHMLEATSATIDSALDNPDPVRARSDIASAAADWERFATGLTKNMSSASPDDAVRGRLTVTGSKGPMEQVDADFVGRATTFAAALRTLSTPGIDDASAAAAIESISVLPGAGGGRIDGGQQDNYLGALLGGALEVSARVQGLETGDLDRVVIDGKFEWVRKVEISQMAPDPMNPANMVMVKSKVPTSQTLSGKNLDVDGKSTNYVSIIVDINGKPAKVLAVAERVPAAGYDHLKTAKQIKLSNGSVIPKGASLTESQIAMLESERSVAEYISSGDVAPTPALEYWQVKVPGYTDAQGVSHQAEVWSQDEDTRLWYKGALPIRGVQRDANGFVKIGDDGRPLIDYKAYASAMGVPSPYAGSDPKAVQNLLNSGAIDVSDIRGRNINGDVTDDVQGQLATAYYAPEDRSQDFKGGSWWGPSAREDRATKMVAIDRQASAEYRQSLDAAVRGLAPTTTDSSPDAALRRMAQQSGINLDGMPARQTFKPTRENSLDSPATHSISGPSLAPKINLALGPTKAATVRMILPPTAKAGAPKVRVKPVSEREQLRREHRPAPKPKPKPTAKAVAAVVKVDQYNRNQHGQLEY